MTIRQLTEKMANQIAAGEVVERPASVVKELVENAIDAGARRIEIATAGGGLNLLRVTDDGTGIAADELMLAVSRHCTSKLGDDIHDIRMLGFRGEALPSIGAVSRLMIRSRVAGQDGAEIRVDNGKPDGPRPAPANPGTLVEVRDLFQATPARLKFMKSHRAENTAISDVIRRTALACPDIHFVLTGSDRSALDYAACAGSTDRIAQVIGREFIDNAVEIDAERDGLRLSGFTAIPSYHRANALSQYVYVNGRPVRDKMIAGAIRGAYSDLMTRHRHPVAALYLTVDPAFVDVNVHPAKADVRFRDPGLVRGLLVGAIRQALTAGGLRANTDSGAAMAASFRATEANTGGWQARPVDTGQSPYRPLDGFGEAPQATFDHDAPSADARAGVDSPPDMAADRPLGAARAQLHETYIVAQTGDGMVIVDQHAAHERLVFEALKHGLEDRTVAAQNLLVPDIIDLPEEDCDRLSEAAPDLERLGLVIERFGPGAVAVRATPAVLGLCDTPRLIADLVDELREETPAGALKDRLEAIASRVACHGSVRSGRRLTGEEMNALLRQMEDTPGAGTCNHGRPTFIELKLSDIERLFGRR